jgi:hypothetical protein
MDTIWVPRPQLSRALERNEAFWEGRLDRGPLVWVTVPDGVDSPVRRPEEPAVEARMWTDVGYVIAAAEYALSRTYYAGDALPVYTPWLGPDQFAAWLGAEIDLKPKDFTSWVTPFIDDWSRFPRFAIDPDNRWWKLYLEILQASAAAGEGKWVTGYPDLHTGIDALSAMRGPEKLLVDLLECPEEVGRAMAQMTELFKFVVDAVSAIVLPHGQGTSNWTMGWSAERFLCIGQNDFTCMISPEMFDQFCLGDTLETTNYVDRSIYHLDGPDAIRHLPRILELEHLDCLQWIQGAGAPFPSRWIDMLRSVQAAGKSVQVYYGPGHGDRADLAEELSTLCRALDPGRLFFWATVGSIEEADHLVRLASERRRG